MHFSQEILSWLLFKDLATKLQHFVDLLGPFLISLSYLC